MNGWLLDTNVVSELRRARPDHRVKAWSDAQAADRLFLSTVTLAEIRYGIESQDDPVFQLPGQGGLAALTRPDHGDDGASCERPRDQVLGRAGNHMARHDIHDNSRDTLYFSWIVS